MKERIAIVVQRYSDGTFDVGGGVAIGVPTDVDSAALIAFLQDRNLSEGLVSDNEQDNDLVVVLPEGLFTVKLRNGESLVNAVNFDA